MLSPPNLSRKLSAIAIAVTASPITDAAGTAQVSDRSYAALNFFLVFISTDARGLFSVGIGFMAALKIIGIPLLMPPSIPPALLDFL